MRFVFTIECKEQAFIHRVQTGERSDSLFYTIQHQSNMTPIQANISSILTNISIGTWLGFLITIATSFGVLYARRKRLKTNLRRSLIAELEQQNLTRVIKAIKASESAVPPNGSTERLELEPSELPPAGTLPSQIYMSNAGNLGILSEQEVKDIVEYYSTLHTQKAIIRAIRSDVDAIIADQKELRNTIPKLEEDRTDLVQKLK